MVRLYSCGSNARGQLGHGGLEDSSTLQECQFQLSDVDTTKKLFDIVDIAMGANHTLILAEFTHPGSTSIIRELWGCGDGRGGQLGAEFVTSDNTQSTVFRKINLDLESMNLGGHSFKAIAATWETSFAVLSRECEADVVISFGSNDFGDLGIGLNNSKTPPHRSSLVHIVSFSSLLGSTRPETLRIQSIKAGQRHVVAILDVVAEDGAVKQVVAGWGSCRNGQIGETTLPKQTHSAAPRLIVMEEPMVSSTLGFQHTVLLSQSGKVLGLGSNRKHQLDVVHQLTGVVGMGATWNGTYLVVPDGTGWKLLASGSNTHGQLGQGPSDVDGTVSISFPSSIDRHNSNITIVCGSEHLLALISFSSDNHAEVWGWGWNEHGNLGVGHKFDLHHPVKIWPPSSGFPRFEPQNIWAGPGTSWISFLNP